MDRRFVHSRFCPVQTIRSSNDESFFTCLKFLVSNTFILAECFLKILTIFLQPGDKTVIVGENNGDVHIFNLHTGTEVSTFGAHDNYIVHLEPNRTGELMLTSSTWGKPVSALWGLNNFDMK